jgi:hypothetical protein
LVLPLLISSRTTDRPASLTKAAISAPLKPFSIALTKEQEMCIISRTDVR